MQTCYHCGSNKVVRNGRTSNGKQRFLCHTCGRCLRSAPGTNAYPPERQEEILRAYHERTSLRGLTRIFGVSRNTVTTWLKKAQRLPPLPQTLAPSQHNEVLELDELWSFVAQRKNKKWVWLALCRRTRQIVAYAIGARDEATCRVLWSRIPATYQHSTLYSDFWEAYAGVLPTAQHQAVSKKSGATNHIERWNNTLRQRLARFVRKTLSFSKSEEMHEVCLRLFVHAYNLHCLSL